MDVANEIVQSLRNLTNYNRMTMVIPAQVTALNESDATVDVLDVDDNEIFDVRIRAAVDELEDGVTIYPAVDSWVLIANLGGSGAEWAVIATTEVEKVAVKIGTTQIDADEQGVSITHSSGTVAIDTNGIGIERGGENLKDVLSDLLTAIKLITVTCAAPGSPSTTPLNFASFSLLETRINNLLK